MKVDPHNPAINSPLENAKQNSKSDSKEKSRDLSASDRYRDRVEISGHYNVEPEEQGRRFSDVDSYSQGRSVRRPGETENQSLATYGRQAIAGVSSRHDTDEAAQLNSPASRQTDQSENESISFERLQEIRNRIANGYYNQNNVIRTVAGLMAEELQK